MSMSTLQELIDARDVNGVKQYMAENGLKLDGNRIVPETPEVSKKLKEQSDFWNQRQQARKILLNSLYGALLNEGLRFYDERLGQSVTLTGRSIVRHMNAKANEVICGTYDYTGESIVYADTDSCYFSAEPMLKNDPQYRDFGASRDEMILLYDGVADVINESFPYFMAKSFNTTLERGAIIKAGRELVASAGLFIKKKKYAVLMYDKEGERLDVIKPGKNEPEPGKLKAMGLDLKRADTPKFMQKFLEQSLMKVLTNVSSEEVFDDIRGFREDFKVRPAWEKGSPKKVSGVSAYGDKLTISNEIGIMSKAKKGEGKVTMPGHVRASMNWNTLCEVNGDRYSMRITDGTRIVVCKLRPNPMKMDSIAFPIDEPHLPQWFKELPFDHPAMEETIIDKKLDNLLGVLEWDLTRTKAHPSDDFFRF